MNNNIRSHLIRVNMLCNERCSFCNVTSDTEPNYKERSLLEIIIEVKRIILQDGGNPKNVKITLSGGEPTLRSDLLKIVLGIRKLGIEYIELQTNATLLKEELAKKLISAGVNRFFISFHSHIEEIFDEYVGLHGAFPIVVKNIKKLSDYENIEVIFNPVVSKKNYLYLKEYFDFVKENFSFVKYISLSFIQPHGEAKKNIDLMLDYKEINEKLYGILDQGYSLGFILNNPYCGLPVCVMGWQKFSNNCIEIIEGKNILDAGKVREDNNKIYLATCKKCVYFGLCGGVWKEYAELYGDLGIAPLDNYC